MLAATRLHTRNGRLCGADLFCHLRLGKALGSPRLQEFGQKRKLVGQFFMFSLYLSMSPCLGAKLLMRRHFLVLHSLARQCQFVGRRLVGLLHKLMEHDDLTIDQGAINHPSHTLTRFQTQLEEPHAHCPGVRHS
jgi:hypothetical protein